MSRDWKYMLVIQIPIDSIGGFDRMVEAEARMEEVLKGSADVSGHDAGPGEGNIFVHTDTPASDFQKALPCLAEQDRDQVRAAYRDMDGETYTILWPPGLKDFAVT